MKTPVSKAQKIINFIKRSKEGYRSLEDIRVIAYIMMKEKCSIYDAVQALKKLEIIE
jgi:hypothetical protein